MSELFQVVYSRPRLRTLVVNPFGKALEEVSELKVETTLIAERVGNALKFIEDLYLAKVYSGHRGAPAPRRRGAAASRASSRWCTRSSTSSTAAPPPIAHEALEMTIIFLIAVEIVLRLCADRDARRWPALCRLRAVYVNKTAPRRRLPSSAAHPHGASGEGEAADHGAPNPTRSSPTTATYQVGERVEPEKRYHAVSHFMSLMHGGRQYAYGGRT